MNFRGNSFTEFDTTNREKLDLSSLQFRLVFGILIVYALGLSSMAIWTGGEMQQLYLIAQPQQAEVNTLKPSQSNSQDSSASSSETSFQNISNHRDLKRSIHSLKKAMLLNLGIITAVSSLLIQRSLLPLRQTTQWMGNCLSDLNMSPLHLVAPPTEIQQITQAWSRLFAQLAETKEQQRQFINNLSHELRTPLSLVYGYLQRILRRDTSLTAVQRETLELVACETEHVIQMLQNLLDLARADSNSMPFYLESVVLNDLITEVATMTERFEHRTVQLEIEAIPIAVQADRSRLMQVLIHLINNAVYYSHADEPITLSLSRIHNQAIIQVRDRGRGMSLSDQAHIFEPLYRVDPSRVRATGGVGLGLSIVKSLMKEMGGQVAVQSQPNEGSTFILTLPVLGERLGER